eukprot:CCRYP_003881-RA/>CCRYP_003881-RA protein AED:0.30 eAED:0.70 QI:0/-1/0/1/-1/0/1/0/152
MLVTTLYEKPQKLYLYIPPHSSHPKGVLIGLIFGQVLCIQCLCLLQQDADKHIQDLLRGSSHRVTRQHPCYPSLPGPRDMQPPSSGGALQNTHNSKHKKPKLWKVRSTSTFNTILRTLLPEPFNVSGTSLWQSRQVTHHSPRCQIWKRPPVA